VFTPSSERFPNQPSLFEESELVPEVVCEEDEEIEEVQKLVLTQNLLQSL
jgi:hypothetical protein